MRQHVSWEDDFQLLADALIGGKVVLVSGESSQG